MANADYTGKDQRMKYLFQNSGSGTQCLYNASTVSDISSNVSALLSAVATANLGIAEIIEIIGGGGGGGTKVKQIFVSEKVIQNSSWSDRIIEEE